MRVATRWAALPAFDTIKYQVQLTLVFERVYTRLCSINVLTAYIFYNNESPASTWADTTDCQTTRAMNRSIEHVIENQGSFCSGLYLRYYKLLDRR